MKWIGLVLFALVMFFIVLISRNKNKVTSNDNEKEPSQVSSPPTQVSPPPSQVHTFSEEEFNKLDNKLFDDLHSESSFLNILPAYQSDTGFWDYLERNQLKFTRLESKCNYEKEICYIETFITQKSKPTEGKDTHCGKIGIWESKANDLKKWIPIQGIAITINSYSVDTVNMVIEEENKRGLGIKPPPSFMGLVTVTVFLTLDAWSGHEQAGHRPALVLSPSSYNQLTGLLVCCPITTQIKGYPFEVKISGVKDNVVLADQVKSLDWVARSATKKGKATPEELDEVKEKVSALLGLRD
ncbi:hypothetical protein FQR65_LT19273 [Abscondita terminalis]|nr:hypothetical protein FQR65_LT19273 [Abscondita terminalis]